jgi:hypothetical protein
MRSLWAQVAVAVETAVPVEAVGQSTHSHLSHFLTIDNLQFKLVPVVQVVCGVALAQHREALLHLQVVQRHLQHQVDQPVAVAVLQHLPVV